MPRLATLAQVLTLTLALAQPSHAEEVVVFAAASLKTALDAVAADFQAETGNTVTISYAGTGQLAKQIIAGAPADIFLSAAENWMDEVEKAGLIAADQRADLWGNTLVLITHDPHTQPHDLTAQPDLPSLLNGGKLAMALVDSVPAGQYGKAALQSLGLWAALEPSVAQSDNVRAALALVASGEAPLGIVYASDAVAEPAVSVISTFPETSHPPIRYPAALLTNAQDPADLAFFKALSSDKAAAIFTAQGFQILP